MKPLFALFWQICRFRCGPEDVPYAPGLAKLLTVAVAGLAGLTILLLDHLVPPPSASAPRLDATGQLVIEWVALGAWLGLIYVLLRFKNLSARFTQTVTALMGADIIMTAPQIVGLLLLASSAPESTLSAIGQFSILFVYIWDILIKGHIYARALNLSRLQGNLLSLAVSYTIFVLSAALIPAQS